ncbi:MAG: TdeIII family type II restriction endonuclease [candidate division Zixibacteria bacterium]|nr:TdeIII family type II restriction endonuclease [Candidatus Tariuqbacter arcticus]
MTSVNARNQIKEHIIMNLSGFEARIKDKVRKSVGMTKASSTSGNLKPFHEALLPNWVNLASTIERSLSTTLGTTYEKCAYIIAKEKHPYAKIQHKIQGLITNPEIAIIDSIIEEIDRDGMRVPYMDYLEQVLQVHKRGGDKRVVVSDIFVKTIDDTEFYFEMKTPKANKTQCLNMTRDMLTISALRRGSDTKVETFFAMPYNPYGTRKEDYNHSIVKTYMDIEYQVLIGAEFWDFLGGKGTFNELIQIYEEVGNEFFKDVIQRIGSD